MKFVTLRVDVGPPRDIVEIELPGVTTLRYAGLRFAEYLGLDTDSFHFFLMAPDTKQPVTPEALAADYDGRTFILGCDPF